MRERASYLIRSTLPGSAVEAGSLVFAGPLQGVLYPRCAHHSAALWLTSRQELACYSTVKRNRRRDLEFVEGAMVGPGTQFPSRHPSPFRGGAGGEVDWHTGSYRSPRP